jgi:hypothetical protein
MTKRSSVWDNALSPARPLILAQGEVAYAYNRLQDKFFGIFNLAMALERPTQTITTYYPYALELWHVIQTDRVQRELALTALAHLPTKLNIKEGVARLKWAAQKTDKLSAYRNLIVHAPVALRYPLPKDGKLPEPVWAIGGDSTKNVHRRRLRVIKDVRFWKTLRNDFLNLSDYVDFVGRQIAWRDYEKKNGATIPGANRSWPRKPRLSSVTRIELIEKAAAATSSPARRRRRKLSRKLPQA